jgi:hypothetical protein
MNRHEELCPHCRAKAGLDTGHTTEAEATMPDLPETPTPIRVHTADRPPFDCTLHPDGTLTAVLGGEVRRNALTFADMCERNWAGAHFELNPPPRTEPAAEPTAAAVQDAIPINA